MSKEINLEDILESIQLENGAIIRSYISKEGNIYKIIREAMKEACERCLDLAAENIKVQALEDFGSECPDCWSENSILQIKNWIK